MKRIIVVLIGLSVVFSAYSQVNGTLSYQGYLTNADGEPENDGLDHQFTFKFYKGTSTTSDFTRGPIFTKVDKGLFTVIIGGGLVGHEPATINNDPLNPNIWSVDYKIGIIVDGGDELPKIPLSSVPYSFQSEIANSVAGSNITGTIEATILSGTIDNARLDPELQDLADGELSGSLVGTGINASNVTTGTLTGSLVGTGIDGGNINDGTIPSAKISGTIAVEDGGTGATTAANARTNLGLAVNSDIQAYNAGLNSISSLSPGADGMLYTTGVDTYALTTITPTGRSILDDSSVGDVRTTLGLGSLATSSNINNSNWSGTELSVANGGTGASTLTGVLVGNGTGAFTGVTATGANQYLRRNAGSTSYEFGTLVVTGSEITDASITNTDINASAAIAGTKVNPNFGSQNITTTAGLHVGGTVDPGVDNLIVDGFTTLGDVSSPAIKIKKLTGTTGAAEGDDIAITHGLTLSKIISVTVIVEASASLHIHPGFTNSAEHNFNWYLTTTAIRIWNSVSQSGSILSKPVKILITYEQ